MKPEKKLYQKFKKNTPLIQHTRIETAVNFGVPDVLCYNDLCGFFMVELKYTTTNTILRFNMLNNNEVEVNEFSKYLKERKFYIDYLE